MEGATELITITDVTLREYGQNIPASGLSIFTPEIRVEIALRLIGAGLTNIEILSCIHPHVAPAMNENAMKKIITGLGRIEGVNLITLVPNESGYRNFLAMDLGPEGYNHTMAIFFSVVESHNLANLGRSIKETIKEYENIVRNAVARKIRVVAYISAAFGYLNPENGSLIKADPKETENYIDLLLGLGIKLVSLSDLQGVANTEETGKILETFLNNRKGQDTDKLGYHPHHISGAEAIANSKVAYDLGIRRFDSSIGGTGGCVTGAPGNQPTEMLVQHFEKLGIKTGLNEQKVFSLSEMMQRELYDRISLEPNRL